MTPRGHKDCFFLILLFIGLVPSIPSQTIVLSTHEQPPLSYTAPDGSVQGTAVSLVRQALVKMGRDYRIQIRPWERAQLEGMTGISAGFFAGSQNAERDAACVPSKPLAWQIQLWYLRPGVTLTPDNPEFKTRLRFGGYAGANMTDYLLTNGYNVIVQPPHLEALILALNLGRIDAFLGNADTVREAIGKLNLSPQSFLTYPQSRRALVVYFNKSFLAQNPGFLEKFNQALEE